MDVVRSGRGRLRAGRAREAHQADDLVRSAFRGQRDQRTYREVADLFRALVPGDLGAVDRGDVDFVPAEASAGAGELALGAAQRADGRLQATTREEREHGEHAFIDSARGDFVACAGGEFDPGIR